jgi:TolB-like protein/DNA-binding SARP family transcriptional activator
MVAKVARLDRVHLRLVGQFRLTDHKGSPVILTSRRARGLIGYLALSPAHNASRDRLCGLLWSDRGDAQARSSLRQCVLDIKTVMAPVCPALLSAQRDEIALTADEFHTDIAELELALTGDDALLVRTQLLAIGTARVLEDQDIGGLYGDWLDQMRARFDQSLSNGVLRLVERYRAREDWAGMVAASDAFLQRDPLDERIVASAISAEVALGASASAQRRFRALKTALERELGVQPSAVVQEAFNGSPAVRISGAASTPTADVEPLLAVLPFDNLSSETEMAFFCDGVSEEILGRITRGSRLKVIGRTSSFQFRGADKAQAGATLKASHVLDGSIQRAGGRVRISAHLLEAATGANLWSDHYDRSLEDIFGAGRNRRGNLPRIAQHLFPDQNCADSTRCL